MVRTIRSESIQQAYDNYPAIRATINLAKKLKYPLFSHLVRKNAYGRISKHLFFVPTREEGSDARKGEYMSNSILYGMLRTWQIAAGKNKNNA